MLGKKQKNPTFIAEQVRESWRQKKPKLQHIVVLRWRKAPYNEEATQFTLEYFILLQDFSHYFLL